MYIKNVCEIIMSSNLIKEKRIPFQNDYTQGIVNYIKEESGVDDIFLSGIAAISASSIIADSKDPRLIFQTADNYFSTEMSSKSPRFIVIDFKDYSVALEGIAIKANNVDWYKKYNVECSNDLISVTSSYTIQCGSFPDLSWQYFPVQTNKPCRYINISVDLNMKTNKGNANLAVYQMELFGEIHHTYKILRSLFTCVSNTPSNLSHYSINAIALLLVIRC